MAGLSIRPVSKRKARSGNKNQNTQLKTLEREAGAGAKPMPSAPLPAGKQHDVSKADARAFMERMKAREAARKARR